VEQDKQAMALKAFGQEEGKLFCHI